MEKLKIVNSVISKTINIPKLLHHKILRNYFPIHNRYELEGKKNADLFD